MTKWEANKDRLALMHQKISTAPKILSKSAGRSSCCIYRVPQGVIDINGQHYQPQVISIGPYHHGRHHLQVIEEHKWRFLGLLLTRTQTKGLYLEHLLNAVQPLESRTRDCYAEIIPFDSEELTEILVLDGCFIIEFFRRVKGLVPFEADDPLETINSIYSLFVRDLIRIENQIPFFVLDCLFNLTLMPGEESGPSLATLTSKFFDSVLIRPDHVIAKYCNRQANHILDFLRLSFIPLEECDSAKPPRVFGANTRAIRSISRMKRYGFSLKPRNEDTFLSIKFNKGVIEMPTISLDDFMASFLLNCVAYEQAHSGRSKHVTTYVILLDCLIKTSEDVEYMSDHNIVENYFGTDDEVAKFVNKMGKGLVLDVEMCHLGSFFMEVKEYYYKSWHVQWAYLTYPYFKNPWSFVSASAAFVLLVLTLLQTIFTILGYFSAQTPRK